jgi:hypothetical protein
VRVSVPEDGVLLYRRRGEEKGMNLCQRMESSYLGAEERRRE